MGMLTTAVGVIFLLFRWDPTPTIEDVMRKRRNAPLLILNEPNAWELQQRARLMPALGVQEETCLWVNSISGYVFTFLSEKLNAAAADGRLESHINGTLQKKKFPDFVCAPVVVSQLSVGQSLPILQSVQITHTDPAHPLEFTATLSYCGSACVSVGTSVCIPHLSFISLPVEVALKSVTLECQAKISIDLVHLPTAHITLTLDPDVHFAFDLHTHLGHKLVLEDINVLQTAFQIVAHEVLREEMVEPNVLKFDVDMWKAPEHPQAHL